jgi:hypothetical protein
VSATRRAPRRARDLIENFNDTLRPGELPRRLLKVVYLGKEGEGNARKLRDGSREPHDWEKSSLVTEVGGYDRMKCSKCNITGRRYGLGDTGTRRDEAYRAKAFEYCDTARALLAKRAAK